jgi:homocitrate synthase NifV
MSGPIICNDQTLCEGFLSGLSHQKISLMVRALHEIQVGSMDIPVARARNYPLSELLLNERLRGKIRPCTKHINWAYQLGFQKVIVSYLHRPGQSLSLDLCVALDRIQSLGLEASVNVENASDLTVQEIEDFWPVLEGFAINTVIYGDLDSRLDPFSTYETLVAVQKNSPFVLEFHAHDAYGLATANTLSALQAGIRSVATAVAGVGKRGHAPFEEVMMAARHLLAEPGAMIEPSLAPACARILACLGKEMPLDKAVVGSNIFAHESGIHVHGVAKNPGLYEAFAPEEVGLVRHLVVGKHSGTTSLQVILRERGIKLSDAAAACLLKKVRKTIVEQNSPISNAQLLQLYQAGDVYS